MVRNKLHNLQQVVNRIWLAKKLGQQYKGKRNIFDALGYPQDSELDFQYYFDRYDRQDIATAIIDRPVDTAWDGFLGIMSVDDETEREKDVLKDAFWKLEKEFGLSFEFSRLDKLVGLGQYAVLLFGFNDVKEQADFRNPLTGAPKLLYVSSFAEKDAHISTWETNPANSRYGQPTMYSLDIATPGEGKSGMPGQIDVHYSRVIHVCENSMMSNIYGTPRLKALINRLIDLEKLMGGDAEMFWKGARPGYFGKVDKDANMSSDEWDELTDQIENYEHDLIRFLHVQGMSVESLAQQIADPSAHVDIQIQAISAKTGIPKRILVGSERGELSSGQDITQWRSLIKTRQRKFCEPKIITPFIDKCMLHGVLPQAEDYVAEWEDMFAPSEKERAEVGQIRANALDSWSKSSLNADAIPAKLVPKLFLGLNDDQLDEIEREKEQQMEEEEIEIREEEEVKEEVTIEG
jgi:uncharacterized protein